MLAEGGRGVWARRARHINSTNVSWSIKHTNTHRQRKRQREIEKDSDVVVNVAKPKM